MVRERTATSPHTDVPRLSQAALRYHAAGFSCSNRAFSETSIVRSLRAFDLFCTACRRTSDWVVFIPALQNRFADLPLPDLHDMAPGFSCLTVVVPGISYP